MNTRYKTCLMILFITITSIIALKCPTNKENCSCELNQGNHNKKTIFWTANINCIMNNNSVFNIYITDYLTIDINCNNSTEWPKLNLDVTHLRSYYGITFNKCSIPNNTKLIDFVRTLGAADSELLHIRSHNNLNLNKPLLDGFKNLKILIINNNNKFNMSNNLLADLKQLTDLFLDNNNLKHLASEFFNYTPQLNILDLSENNLTLIAPNTFDKLKHLELMIIRRNNLVELQSGIFNKLVSLSILNIAANKLVSLPKNLFQKMKNLTELYLSENNFTYLPKDLLRNNSELRRVFLNSNKRNLTLLNGFFSNLTALKYLELRNNGLIELPEDLLWGSFQLVFIDVTNNYIKSCPEHIFRDSINLNVLAMNFNNIKVLPDNIFKNTNKLSILDLSNNRITSISKQLFNKLNNLKVLNMSQNHLKYISDDSFTSLENLKYVDLSNNHLILKCDDDDSKFQSISPFYNCLSLIYLYLNNNNISKICSDWIKFHNLEILDLSYNNISSVKATDLQFGSNYIKVYLTHNKIQHIFLNNAKNDMIEQNYEYHNITIFVENNPLRCDCKLYDFLRYIEGNIPSIRNNFQIESRNLTCHNPEKLKNMRIKDLSSKNLTCRIKNTDFITVCPKKCDCFLRPENRTFIFNCAHKNLTDMPSDMKKLDISLIQNLTSIDAIFQFELNFSNNRLTQMPFLKNMKLGLIKTLALSHNNISEISLDELSNTLEILELHNNNISNVRPDVLEFLRSSNNLTLLTLHKNPWKCDCDTTDFLHFIHTKYSKISDLSSLLQVKCNRVNQSIIDMTYYNFCPFGTTVIVSSSATIATVGLLIGLIFGFYYKYQKHIKVWLYAHQWCLWFVTEEELDKDKLYDAFITFSHKDHDFIVDELVSKLESDSTPYKLCLHYRDWLAGEWISDNIARSIENSRRTIVVLSPNFLKSVWGRMEFRTAHCQALSEGRARVILILYGDIGPTDNLDSELKTYMSTNTYIQWGDPWFWDKLKYALPHQFR